MKRCMIVHDCSWAKILLWITLLSERILPHVQNDGTSIVSQGVKCLRRMAAQVLILEPRIVVNLVPMQEGMNIGNLISKIIIIYHAGYWCKCTPVHMKQSKLSTCKQRSPSHAQDNAQNKWSQGSNEVPNRVAAKRAIQNLVHQCHHRPGCDTHPENVKQYLITCDRGSLVQIHNLVYT